MDSDGKVIYVGKAKNLKNRVSSYFANPERLNAKTRALVSKIADVKYTVVESEQDAFLLENNLIKENQPRYNILLKDSKTYPWICIKNENFPRVFTTRHLSRDGSLYFGPYSSAGYANSLVDMFHSMFRLRTCSLKLNAQDIAKGKFKECLNFHIGKCDGPCIGKIAEESYNENIEAIKNILKGNASQTIRLFKEKMNEAASALEFEKAQMYKERSQLLNAHYNKSLIVQPTLANIDVFSILFTDSIAEGSGKGSAFGNYFRVVNGCITRVMSLEMKTRGDLSDNLEDLSAEESRRKMLTHFILSVYNILSDAGEEACKEVLVPFMPEEGALSSDQNVHVPLRGDKLSLLELSTKNAREFMLQALRQEALKNPQEKKSIGVEMLKRDLHLKEYPNHIECFDNSNIQGTDPVASCVVFRHGKPSKKDYRKFHIKSVVGANDFASMYEVVWRRYSRLMQENPQDLPQLVVVDGGRGQLDFAYKALEDLGLEKRMPIIGIAKRLEELIRPGDPNPLFLDKNSPSLKIIMQLRDEAHRFGITFHRSLRSKHQTGSELEEIKGIGQKTSQKLLQHFKSVARVKKASLDELTAVAGKAAALRILEHFNEV